MCGVAGFLISNLNSMGQLEEIVTNMVLTVAHRGPDDAGAWAEMGIALGHRRLSVIDLSEAGHQPMESGSGRFVISFNGEIYNHMELRAQLEKISGLKRGWIGHSDTETLIAGFEAWGVEVTLKRSVGMFAFALWDRKNKELTLARDRFGEKPMFYGWAGSGTNAAFVFGSELKALCAYPGFDNQVSREALSLYMRFNYVPAPHSIYTNIFKLEPGCMLTIASGTALTINSPPRPPFNNGQMAINRWWSLASAVQYGAGNQITEEAEVLNALEHRLGEAVRLQSLSDVPLGAFLSGGVDSSTIVALMQQQTMHQVKTFTVGFEEADFDESPNARAVAKHLGTDHTELFVTANEAQDVIPKLPYFYDEPFADSSQIPTYLVCKAASHKVTVALSGDAGDELFGGYTRYFWGPRIWSRLAWLPFPARQLLGRLICSVPIPSLDSLGRAVNALIPSNQGILRTGDKAHKLGLRLSSVRNMDDLYLSLVSEWQDPAQVVKGVVSRTFLEKNAARSFLDFPLPHLGTEQHQLRMMYLDSMTYLPDDILCKVDRAAMATSLETRVPFLDHRVVELAWQIPLHMKIRGNESKWALRQVLHKYVPRELIDRPKAGFGIPVGQWLKGPLKDWAESLLAESRLESEGYFYPSLIRQKWAEHLSGRRDHTASLWTVLMFQAWLEERD
jgi:asparagine synthase (glutamine-hydrolysing)